MTVQLLVNQLRFTRTELVRCLEGVTDTEAQKRIEPMNSISWIVGHLADQENLYWVRMAQGIRIFQDLKELVGYGRPPSTPPLDEMWSAWREITSTADRYLDSISTEELGTYFEVGGKQIKENVGTLLMRNTYHYWFHTGEAYAIRQILGHSDLPDFVGIMSQAAYQPEK
jgi:uncharacterized damage-inducible protein DinB